MSGPASPMGISWRTIIGGDRKSRNFDFLQMQDPKVDVRRLKLMSGGSVSNRIGAGAGCQSGKFTLAFRERDQFVHPLWVSIPSRMPCTRR